MSKNEQTDGRADNYSASVTVAADAAAAVISELATSDERPLGLRRGREPQHSLDGATRPISSTSTARSSSLERRSAAFPTHHESFLEIMARQECQNFYCMEHNNHINGNNNSSRTQSSNAENDEDGRNEERRRFFVSLEFDSDDNSSSDSEYDTSTEEEVDDNDILEDGNVEEDYASDNQGDTNDQRENRVLGEDDGINEADTAHSIIRGENFEMQQENSNSVPALELPSITYTSNMDATYGTNLNYQRIASLLLSLSNSEEMPLIRADIPWSLIISCGSMPSLLLTLYRQTSDTTGARLLQGVLRMDPPLEAVKVLLDAFPISCLDMEGFFTACQFVHPNTSRRLRLTDIDRSSCSVNAAHNNNNFPGDMPNQDDDSDFDIDDVGEVVKLVMHQTIRVRRLNSIDWGMVAFLGDARISPSQAKLLLRHAPEALIDPKHGAFGVSPLDRMVSGVFIHGDTTAWVEKLRIALRVAAFVKQRRKQLEREESPSSSTSIVLPAGFFCSDSQLLRRRESDFVRVLQPPSAQSFYPYHELIRLLVSPNYQGNKFGQHGFLETLRACTRSEPDAFLRQDGDGNLPIHIALRSECETVLGVKGERRLIKYLLDLDPNTSLCPEGSDRIDGEERRLPLRLSILNAWPVYDLIITAALACCDTGLLVTAEIQSKRRPTDYIAASRILYRPLLHDALSGKYHPRFGIHGARQLVKKILQFIANYNCQQRDQSNKCHHHLTNFVDVDGRTALHISLESKWPVYDLLVQANPNFCLEFRDPSGFFPFQIAACAFRATCANKDTKVILPKQSEAKDMLQPTSGSWEEARGSIPADQSEIVNLEGDQEGVDLIELSMLFELIRESPLCVTWRTPFNEEVLKKNDISKKRKFPSSQI